MAPNDSPGPRCGRRTGAPMALALIAVAAGLGGCSGDGAADRAPAPTPAPFRPQAVEVPLGQSGSSLTLITAEGGGFTRNGEAFRGGRVQAENGSGYELALVDGRWVATYIPPEPVALALGTSGTSVSVTRNETGEHRIGELVLADGTTVRADNGQAYRLSRIDGAWVAEHVLPDPVEVPLGASGTAATLQQIEDLTWRIAEGVRERPFASGDQVRTETGSSYRLVLADGRWTASFVPVRTEIALGESGASVVATQAENGEYLLGTAMLAEGHEYLHEASGNTYVFSRQGDGRWTASFKPLEQRVRLGPYGTVTLAQREDGTWWRGDRLVEDGDEVTATVGPSYRLALTDGRWTASFVPEQSEIAGTGLVAVSTESGRGYRVGESATLPASGEGDVEVGGALYRVWRENGGLRGIRFDREPHGRSAGEGNYHLGLESGAARLGEDKPDTPGNEAGTTLLVAGTEFSLGELLSSGHGNCGWPSNLGGRRNQAHSPAPAGGGAGRGTRHESGPAWSRTATDLGPCANGG